MSSRPSVTCDDDGGPVDDGRYASAATTSGVSWSDQCISCVHHRCSRASMTHPLYVIGGRQRSDRALLDVADSWYGYGLGVILKVDGSGVTTAFEYTSRPGTCGPDDAVLFKCASLVGDRLYCCTQTEVLVLALPDFTEIAYISLPIFNDVHHVVPTAVGHAPGRGVGPRAGGRGHARR